VFCFKCGNKIADGALFCGNCGTKIQLDGPAPQQAAPQQVMPQAPVNAAPAPQQVMPQAPVNAAPAPQQVMPQAPVNAAPAPQQVMPQAPVNAAPAPQQVMPQAPVNAAPAPQQAAPQQINPAMQYVQQTQQINQAAQQADVNSAAAQQAAQFAQQTVQQAPVQPEKPKKEKKTKVKKEGKKFPVKWVVIGGVAAVVIAIGCVCFFSKTVRAAIMKATMSDEDYYKYVEKQSLKDGLDLFADSYDILVNETFNLADKKVTMKGEVEIGSSAKDFFDELESRTRVDLTWLTQADGSFTFGIKDTLMDFGGEINVNKQKLFDIDLLADLATGNAYANIPVLSDKYLSIPVENYVRNTESMEEYFETYKKVVSDMPTASEIKKIGEHYIDAIVDSLSNIKITEDKTIKANKVSAECTMYTVKINEEDALNIAKSICEQASIDNDLATVIKRLEKTEQVADRMDYDKFLDLIEEALAMIDKELENPDLETGFYMNVYVDNAANVLGREFGIFDNEGIRKPVAGYKFVTADDQYGFDAFADYSESRDDYRYRLASKGTVSGRKLTGKVQALRYDSVQGELEFKDFNVSALQDGELEITFVQNLSKLTDEKIARGVTAELGLDFTLRKGQVSVGLVKDNNNIIKFTGSVTSGSGSSIKVPSNVIVAEDEDDLMTWVEQLKFKELINNMKDAKFPDEIVEPLELMTDLGINGLGSIMGGNFGLRPSTNSSAELEAALNQALMGLDF